MQNSPLELATEVAKRPRQWRHISDKGNTYALKNEPIESLDMPIQKIGAGNGGCFCGDDCHRNCHWMSWGHCEGWTGGRHHYVIG